jgi:hypothetical protein
MTLVGLSAGSTAEKTKEEIAADSFLFSRSLYLLHFSKKVS